MGAFRKAWRLPLQSFRILPWPASKGVVRAEGLECRCHSATHFYVAAQSTSQHTGAQAAGALA